MEKDITIEIAAAKAMNKLKVVLQTLYSDPKMAYNVLCSIQKDLDSVALSLLTNIK